MSHLGMIEKSPEDVLDYDVDFTRWLADADRVTGATATIADSSAAVGSVEVADTSVKIWISGGAAGESGELSLIATTLQGRTKEVCLRLRVKGC